MNILLATDKPFSKEAVDSIKKIAQDYRHNLIVLEKYGSPDTLKQAVADADALIVRSDKITPDIIAAANGRLKIIVRAGAGYDNIDLPAATAAGIVVENTPGQNSNAVAELVFGMAIMMARNMYNGTTGIELKGKHLGIHAFGQVGRNVARIAHGFEMQTSALDPYCPDSVMLEAGVQPIHDLPSLYRNNTIISLHIPATAETKKSVGKQLITLMPKGGILINTARKEIIDEDSLIEALRQRPDLRYAADIAPDCAEQMQKEFPGRVFFTPKKMGAQTAEANANAGMAAARQIGEFFANGDTRFKVNK